MGKVQTMYRDRVCNTDEFLSLSVEAQCLYFHLGFDADSIGELVGVNRLAGSYQMGGEQLAELREAGYLLVIDGRWFITHHAENNAKPRNDSMRKAAERLWEKKPGSLDYEGELFNSKLVSLAVGESKPSDRLTVASNSNSIGISNDTDKNTLSGKPDHAQLIADVIGHLNQRTGKNFKPGTKATTRIIEARIADGYNLADFQRVIDLKVSQWANDAAMSRYLRPETLFGSKFESYLNEQEVKSSGKHDEYN